MAIREQDPLKQGLKPRYDQEVRDKSTDSRARSTKTRIETISIRVQTDFHKIREQDPLKQGLKLY